MEKRGGQFAPNLGGQFKPKFTINKFKVFSNCKTKRLDFFT